MLHIRQLSDLHLEFYYDLYEGQGSRAREEIARLLPPLPTDKKTVLIVAGDLATAHKAGRIVTFFELVVPRFKHVVYVLGNHEHYGCNLHESEAIIRHELSQRIDMRKMSIMGNTPASVVVKGVAFIGGTLWTDYMGGDYRAMTMAARFMRDHSVIGSNVGKGDTFQPEEAFRIHVESVAKIREIAGELSDHPIVIVSHHLPSFDCVDEQYKTGSHEPLLNGAFASNLDALIIELKPRYWFFGHTHTSFNGTIGDTRLICNPLGYPHERNDASSRFGKTEVYSI